MPQLIHTFFINQFVWSFGVLIIMVYVLGTYILPMFTSTNVSRIFVTNI